MEKIPFETIREILDERIAKETTVDFYGIEIKVKYMITHEQYDNAIGQIMNCCYDDASGEYLPELRELATRTVIVAYYTNLELPDDVDDLNYLLFASDDLMDGIYSAINRTQLQELHRAVAKRCEVRNEANRKFFENEIKEVTDGIESMASGIQGLFDGVSSDDMRQLVKVLGEGRIDEEKLVNAVVKARSEDYNNEAEKVIPFPVEEQKDGE